MTGHQIALNEPYDTCFRCGKQTPAGVPLCEHDNPARIKGPSTTQVHGTIAVGLIGGFVLLLVLFTGFIVPGADLLEPVVSGTSVQADGSTHIVVSVTNTGDTPASASCRVSRGSVVGAGDVVFYTQVLQPGETRQFARTLPAVSRSGATAANAFSVRCN